MQPARVDAWVLAAVAYAGGDDVAPLWRIVATGDFLNHAIFLEDELVEGLSRLFASGLLVRRGERIGVTARGAELTRRALDGADSHFDMWMDRLPSLMPAPAVPDAEDVARCRAWIRKRLPVSVKRYLNRAPG